MTLEAKHDVRMHRSISSAQRPSPPVAEAGSRQQEATAGQQGMAGSHNFENHHDQHRRADSGSSLDEGNRTNGGVQRAESLATGSAEGAESSCKSSVLSRHEDGGSSQQGALTAMDSGHGAEEEAKLVEAVRRRSQISTAGQLIAGGVAGAVSKTCTAPLARLTILFQLQGMHDSSSVKSRPPSIWREAARIMREEGFTAFWKGNTVTIIHRLPYSAINFFAYESYKSMLEALVDSEAEHNLRHEVLHMGIKLVAGGGAGITAATITYPLDLVRTRLAAQTKSRYYRGILGTLSTIARDEGLLGLYKGMGATLLGVGPNLAINFCVYETVKAKWIDQHPQTPTPLVSLGCGSLAGICSSSATFPLDLVRRRMQLEGAGGRAPVYKTGIIGTFSHIVKNEGWLALYRGIIPEYYKVVPGVSIAFMTYEFMKRLFRPPSIYLDNS